MDDIASDSPVAFRGSSLTLHQPAERTCLMVLGMHRSGASALAGVLARLGCNLPKTTPDAASLGEAYASGPISELTERILQSAGRQWSDWSPFNPVWFKSSKANGFRKEARALIEEELEASSLWLLKDPRIGWLAGFWPETLETAGITPLLAIVIRNPLEVAESLATHNDIARPHGLLLWLRHVLDTEYATRGRRRAFVGYEQLMSDWTQVARSLQEAFGLQWPRFSSRAPSEINEFLDPGLWHHRSGSKSIRKHPPLPGWQRRVFTILRGWAQHGESSADFAELDAIRNAFDAAGPAFEPLLAVGHTQELANLRRELQDLRTLRSRERDKSEAELAAQAVRLRQRFDEIAALTRLLAAAEDSAAALRAATNEQRNRLIKAMLGGPVARFLPGRLRVRLQMARLKRSGLFDPEWYARHYKDIAESGVDPLWHFVAHGLKEDRAPNPVLASTRSES